MNFRLAGDLSQLPQDLQDFLQKKEEEFHYDNDRFCVLAINYGGQDEILRAVKKLSENQEEISQKNLEKYMDF